MQRWSLVEHNKATNQLIWLCVSSFLCALVWFMSREINIHIIAISILCLIALFNFIMLMPGHTTIQFALHALGKITFNHHGAIKLTCNSFFIPFLDSESSRMKMHSKSSILFLGVSCRHTIRKRKIFLKLSSLISIVPTARCSNKILCFIILNSSLM